LPSSAELGKVRMELMVRLNEGEGYGTSFVLAIFACVGDIEKG